VAIVPRGGRLFRDLGNAPRLRKRLRDNDIIVDIVKSLWELAFFLLVSFDVLIFFKK